MTVTGLTHTKDRDILASAAAVGLWAQRRAGVTVRELSDVADLQAVTDMLGEIWGPTDDIGPPVKSDLLRALAHARNYVAGAFDDNDALRGALVGFLGEDDDGVHLHSHILGVAATGVSRGVGFALKLHQRAWALGRGHDVVEWTFDPLVRRNAFFNLTKLGGELHSYHVNFYGAMGDVQNGDDDSDRVTLRWNLRADRVVAAAAGVPRVPQPHRNGSSPEVVLALGDEGQPVIREPSGDGAALILQLPEDIVALRRARPDLGHAWRRALRDSLTGALASGYHCDGLTRAGEYVLTQPGVQAG
jgi:predicted GNAT superfamily acetyltransferase